MPYLSIGPGAVMTETPCDATDCASTTGSGRPRVERPVCRLRESCCQSTTRLRKSGRFQGTTAALLGSGNAGDAGRAGMRHVINHRLRIRNLDNVPNLPTTRGQEDPRTMTPRCSMFPVGRRARRWQPSLIATAGGIALWLAFGWVWAQPYPSADRFARQEDPAAHSGPSQPERSRHQIREGTEVVDRLGYFRTTADRVTFFSEDGKDRFVVLENLSLERIARAIGDNPTQLQWSISGTVTEYHGSNFMLIRRAILKSQVPSEEAPF